MTTLFKKDPENLGRVINEIDPENEWVFEFGIPTRKYDGSACAIINGELYKRYDSKINKKTGERNPIQDGAIPCGEPDNITGHWPHWVKCDRINPSDKWHFKAFDIIAPFCSIDGTYELCGEKIQKNPEKIKGHELIAHGYEILKIDNFTYDSIKNFLSITDIEGIVFHHEEGDKMCKIRKSDFGLKRK